MNTEDSLQPVKTPKKLKSIHIDPPPKNTQVKPRCLTCRFFEICKYRTDYLKTVTEVQRALGDQAVKMEITHEDNIPNFFGIKIVNWGEFFPEKISLSDSELPLLFNIAKFQNLNFVSLIYQTPKNVIRLNFEYVKDEENFNLISCKDAYYASVDYEVDEESLEKLKEGLLKWREKAIEEKKIPLFPQPPHKEVINTTHFSAILECDNYEWNQKKYEDAVKYYSTIYPEGIPIDGEYYHIATFHVANQKVPFSPLYNEETGVVNTPFEKKDKEARKRKELF